MNSFTSLSLRSLFLFGAGSLIACGGPEILSDEEAADTFATTSSALCTDSGAEDVSASLGSQQGSTVSGTSSGGTYGGPDCTNAYVVEALATAGKNVVLSGSWVDSAVRDSAALCHNARLQVFAYGSLPGSTTWTSLGSISVSGSWDDVFGCSFMWVPEHSVNHLSPSPYARLRVAARAYTLSGIVRTYRRVKASIAVPLPPPNPPSFASDASPASR